MTDRRPWLCVTLFFWILFSSFLSAAQDSTLVAGAKKEGRIVWYTGTNIESMRAVASAFEGKYPFLKVEITRASSEKLVNRIRTEKGAGRVLFDVVNSSLTPLLLSLDVLTPYDSPARKAFSAKFKDPRDYWTSMTSNYFVLGYNLRFVSHAQAPKDWSELLDPKWKGKFGMDPEEYDWLGAMTEALGREKTEELMRGLARQDIRWHKGHSQVAQLLAAGEFPLALVYAHTVENLKAKGASMDWARTMKPIIASTSMVGVASRAEHPNGARLLVDFILSTEGQSVMMKHGAVPAHPQVLPKDSPLNPVGLDLYPISARILENLNEHARKFEEFFGPRR